MKKTESIQWERYVDRVFCVYYLPNKKRMERLHGELERVGLLGSPIFEWRFTTPSPYDSVIQKSYKDKKWINSIGCLNASLEVLRILKESRLLGYKRILILEDDVAFLKDLSELERILSCIPEGYDMVQLDKGCWGRDKVAEWESIKNDTINEWFVDAGRHHFGLSDANIYMPSGMDLAIRVLDNKPIAGDQLNYEGVFRTAIARKNACIQILFKNSNYNNGEECHCIYRDIGIDYGKYSLPEGYGYGKLYDPKESDLVPQKKVTKRTKKDSEVGRWDVFDYVGVVCYTGYQDRVKELMPELERVGLKEKAHFHWDVPSVFRDKLFAAVKKSPFCAKGGCFHMTVQHYTVIKTAYELGCNSILVLEDDVRFLRDLGLIDEMLGAIPLGYDHLMLDRNKLTDEELSSFADLTDEQKRNRWVEFSVAGSTGCYVMSRRGMRRYLEIIEADVIGGVVRNPDYYFRDAKDGRTFWDKTYRRYFCYPNMAVQSIVGKNGSFSDLGDYWKHLFAAGIRQEDYNLGMSVVSDGNFEKLLWEQVEKQDKEMRGGVYDCGEVPQIDAVVGKGNRMTANSRSVDRVYVWGDEPTPSNKVMLQRSMLNGSQIVLSKDGLISSVAGSGDNCASAFKAVHSVVMDTRAYYCDAVRTSSLELMLNDFNLLVMPKQRAEARRLITKVVSNKVSHFNGLPLEMPKIGREGRRKVLVVDQAEGDYEVTQALADEGAFSKMLKRAMEENEDADIIIKVTSDDGVRIKGHYEGIEERDGIYKVTFPINPYSLLERCDKVYVVSAQIGLEALMAGKEVHVFGMPFYAGWGLTMDERKFERRTNMRTLEELFYIFCCMYTHWVDPDRGCETTMDAVVDKMIALRGRYFRNKGVSEVRRYSTMGWDREKRSKVEIPTNGRLMSRGFVTMGGVRQRDDGDWW